MPSLNPVMFVAYMMYDGLENPSNLSFSTERLAKCVRLDHYIDKQLLDTAGVGRNPRTLDDGSYNFFSLRQTSVDGPLSQFN